MRIYIWSAQAVAAAEAPKKQHPVLLFLRHARLDLQVRLLINASRGAVPVRAVACGSASGEGITILALKLAHVMPTVMFEPALKTPRSISPQLVSRKDHYKTDA